MLGFVREMIIDCLGTLGAPQRVDHEIVLHVGEADEIGHDSLRHPPFALGADAPVKRHDAIVHRDGNVSRVQSAMFGKPVANESPQLSVIQVIDVVDVLEIMLARHVSPHHPTWRAHHGRRRYRKNKYDTPIERVRLFVQSLFESLLSSTLVPSLVTS